MKIKEFVAKNWKKLLVVVIVLISIIYFVFGRKTNISKTDTVKKGSLSEELVLSGEITAKNYAKLYFETPGKINYVGVSDGDKVYKGKLLSKLDTTVLNSSYQIALSNLRAAEATVSNILKSSPELCMGIDIYIAGLLSPNDVSAPDLNITSTLSGEMTSIKSKLLEVVREWAKDEYKIDSCLS